MGAGRGLSCVKLAYFVAPTWRTWPVTYAQSSYTASGHKIDWDCDAMAWAGWAGWACIILVALNAIFMLPGINLAWTSQSADSKRMYGDGDVDGDGEGLSSGATHFFACWRIKFIWELRCSPYGTLKNFASTLPHSVWLAAKHKFCKTQQITRQAFSAKLKLRLAATDCRLLLVTVRFRFTLPLCRLLFFLIRLSWPQAFYKFILWACSFQFGSKLPAKGLNVYVSVCVWWFDKINRHTFKTT